MSYTPQPIDVSRVQMPQALADLTERLAEHAHDVWSAQRLRDGWSYGPRRDDEAKTHPCLVPYGQLPDSEKQYDRNAVEGTLRAVLALGYRIERPA